MKKNKFIEVIGTIVFASLLFFAFNTNASPRVIQKVAVQVTTAAENIAIQASLSPPTITKVNVESGLCSRGAINTSSECVSPTILTLTCKAVSFSPPCFQAMNGFSLENTTVAELNTFALFTLTSAIPACVANSYNNIIDNNSDANGNYDGSQNMAAFKNTMDLENHLNLLCILRC